MDTKEKNFTVLKHPIIDYNLSIIRDKNTTCENFRNAVKKISYALIYEAVRDIPLREIEVETPLKKTKCLTFDDSYQIILAPILRAGLVFSEIAMEFLPFANVHHIGMYRNEKTLEPVWYYDKIKKISDDKSRVKLIILDPMLATGNSSKDVIENFIEKGVDEKNITFMCLIAAPEGVENITSTHPHVRIITAAYDESLNPKGYILPGLGDAGDRIFNTLY